MAHLTFFEVINSAVEATMAKQKMLKLCFLIIFSTVISFNEKLHAVHFSIVDAGVDDDLNAGKLVRPFETSLRKLRVVFNYSIRCQLENIKQDFFRRP